MQKAVSWPNPLFTVSSVVKIGSAFFAAETAFRRAANPPHAGTEEYVLFLEEHIWMIGTFTH